MTSASTDRALAELFDRLVEGGESNQSTKHSLELAWGARSMRVCFTGENLLELRRPLAHLRPTQACSGATTPIFELHVGSAEAATKRPDLPWDAASQWYLGEIPNLKSDRFQINYHPPADLLCLLDNQRQRALFWLTDSKLLPFWELGAPFRIIFHWWAQSWGAHMAHAAAVGRDKRGVLLVGRGGSGKSSLSMACLDRGMHTAGDDYLLLARDPDPVVLSLYNTAKLHTEFLKEQFSHLETHVARTIGPEDKSVFFLHEFLSGQLSPRLQIRALVMPKVTGGHVPVLQRRSPMEGLLALAPSTAFQLPGARETALGFLGKWMQDLPVYRLETGQDVMAAAQAVDSLLASL